MKCPKCGRENLDNPQICDFCSFVLAYSPAKDGETKAKTSKVVVIELIMLVIGTISSFISAALNSPQTVIIITVLMMIFGIKGLIEIKKGK